MLLITHGCASISFGVGRVRLSTVNLGHMNKSQKYSAMNLHPHLFDKVLHVVAPLQTRLVFQSGRLECEMRMISALSQDTYVALRACDEHHQFDRRQGIGERGAVLDQLQ
jgi:hypothetical protein